MAKIDFKKELKDLYCASAKNAALVDVPELSFLMVDGSGDPNTSVEYRDAVGALYSLSYGLKFAVKNGEDQVDFAVMPLEGLWWSEDPADFTLGRKDKWQWTAMIMQPRYVTFNLYAEVLKQTRKKKPSNALSKVRLATFKEGLCAQIMHLGPYSGEAPTITRLHDFIRGQGHSLAGKHHEIYLGNPERSAPEKLKTIVRQPVA
jgi:hypothetical protein